VYETESRSLQPCQPFTILSVQHDSNGYRCRTAKKTLSRTHPGKPVCFVSPHVSDQVKEFKPSSLSECIKKCFEVTNFHFRTDLPEYIYCSLGTLIHFDHLSFHEINCYYHQDLHLKRLQPVSRLSLLCHFNALLHAKLNI
jgi:hypothetical protein